MHPFFCGNKTQVQVRVEEGMLLFFKGGITLTGQRHCALGPKFLRISDGSKEN